MDIDLTPTTPATTQVARILGCILGQKNRNRTCPALPRLDGKRALVTGGAAGVGEFISRGLLERGAAVATMARGMSQGTLAIPGIDAHNVDLSDPTTIVSAVECLGEVPFDLVVCNAGIVSKQREHTPTGVEKTFGVNVLGHHILYRLLMERGLLAQNARIIITTGDIYISAKGCSPEMPFDSTQKAYSRSKLGNLWQVRELKARYPELHPIAVHPGVVASGFTGSKRGFFAWLRRGVLISEAAGAQASLIGATQDLPRGAYWHNVLGVVDLQGDDPALDAHGSTRLWNQLEDLAAPYIA